MSASSASSASGQEREEQERELALRTGAFCALLGEPGGLRDGGPELTEAVERALGLLAAGPGTVRPGAAGTEALREALGAVDGALRRAGDARGLGGGARGPGGSPLYGSELPGVRASIKVALCPRAAPCDRREPARDLWPAPQCPVSGERMRKERLRRST